ncbi:hypothetical protein A0J61_05790 [Choanephora cucurbitarum]|uniref:CENP-T/Histone H4 histone fold domain-containing protein n=1 Tax=Choanephora cucurbitarum TaxID=101091 RepID=A0A1C7NBL9_9FUNG|nr:hypothetical protein A0J61_05790 [Choanephora cucurbitarum]
MDNHVEIRRTVIATLSTSSKRSLSSASETSEEQQQQIEDHVESYVPKKRARVTESQFRSDAMRVNYDRLRGVELGLFRRMHRHVDHAPETLSPISQRSHNSFSRFNQIPLYESNDRRETVFKHPSAPSRSNASVVSTSTSTSISSLPSVSSRPSMRPLSSSPSILVSKPAIPPQHQYQHQQQHQQQQHQPQQQQLQQQQLQQQQLQQQSPSTPPIKSQTKTRLEQLEQSSRLSPIPNQQMFQFNDDGDIGLGDEGLINRELGDDRLDQLSLGHSDDNQSIHDDDIEVIPPPKDTSHRISPTDCLTRRLLGDPFENQGSYEESDINYFTKSEVEMMFRNRLDPSKKLRNFTNTRLFSKITDLFFEHIKTDLLAYKQNQPASYQHIITENDVILLMKRQRFLTDTSNIQSLASRYLSKTYCDRMLESVAANNRIRPADGIHYDHQNQFLPFDDESYFYDSDE